MQQNGCPLQVLRESVPFMSESFRLDQPQANDLVGNPLLIAGSGGGFEAVIDVRVLDGNGQVLAETSVTSSNLTSAWQTSVSLPDPPPTNRGVVQVGPSTGADEAPPRVSVPVFYGAAIRRGSVATSCTPSNPGHAVRHRRVAGAAIHRQRLRADLRGQPAHHRRRSRPYPPRHRAALALGLLVPAVRSVMPR